MACKEDPARTARWKNCFLAAGLLVSRAPYFSSRPDESVPALGATQPALTTPRPLGQFLATSHIGGPDFAKKNPKGFLMPEGRGWGQPVGVEISLAAMTHQPLPSQRWPSFTRCTADGARGHSCLWPPQSRPLCAGTLAGSSAASRWNRGSPALYPKGKKPAVSS